MSAWLRAVLSLQVGILISSACSAWASNTWKNPLISKKFQHRRLKVAMTQSMDFSQSNSDGRNNDDCTLPGIRETLRSSRTSYEVNPPSLTSSLAPMRSSCLLYHPRLMFPRPSLRPPYPPVGCHFQNAGRPKPQISHRLSRVIPLL